MESYLIKDLHKSIIILYKQGLSAREIKEQLHIKISIRQIQRYLKSLGIIRTSSDAFRLAVKLNKVKYEGRKKRKTIPLKLRYYIFQRDKFKCRLCGNTANEMKLEIDHIDNDPVNNKSNNLQILCGACNMGKSRFIA